MEKYNSQKKMYQLFGGEKTVLDPAGPMFKYNGCPLTTQFFDGGDIIGAALSSVTVSTNPCLFGAGNFTTDAIYRINKSNHYKQPGNPLNPMRDHAFATFSCAALSSGTELYAYDDVERRNNLNFFYHDVTAGVRDIPTTGCYPFFCYPNSPH